MALPFGENSRLELIERPGEEEMKPKQDIPKEDLPEKVTVPIEDVGSGDDNNSNIEIFGDVEELNLSDDYISLEDDPMRKDYEEDVGLGGDDFSRAATGAGRAAFKENRLKDVPCRFYDGVSDGCWKGSRCLYGHEKHTGGVFAKKYPDIAYAVANRLPTTSVTMLADKPQLTREADLVAEVTHVVSPSEFYVKLKGENGHKCFCAGVETLFTKWVKEDEKRGQIKEVNMDNYIYGFSGLELHEGTTDEAIPNPPATSADKLNSYLSTASTYMRYQSDLYAPNVELVAVRLNLKWFRAIVTAEFPEEMKQYRVQLLDTGEKRTVSTKDMCRLPQKFCDRHAAAFRCCLFGVSPVWCVWSRAAIEYFKNLVTNKFVRIIIKEGVSVENQPIFCVAQERPYIVKVLITKTNDSYSDKSENITLKPSEQKLEPDIDVTREIINAGYGLEWSPFPLRPFISTVMSTEGFDFLRSPMPPSLPPTALVVENRRLAWQKKIEDVRDYNKSDDIEMYSSTDSSEMWRKNFRREQVQQMSEAHEYLKIERKASNSRRSRSESNLEIK